MLYEDRGQMIQKLDQAQILRLLSLEAAQQSVRSDFKETQEVSIQEIITRAECIYKFINGYDSKVIFNELKP